MKQRPRHSEDAREPAAAREDKLSLQSSEGSSVDMWSGTSCLQNCRILNFQRSSEENTFLSELGLKRGILVYLFSPL